MYSVCMATDRPSSATPLCVMKDTELEIYSYISNTPLTGPRQRRPYQPLTCTRRLWPRSLVSRNAVCSVGVAASRYGPAKANQCSLDVETVSGDLSRPSSGDAENDAAYARTQASGRAGRRTPRSRASSRRAAQPRTRATHTHGAPPAHHIFIVLRGRGGEAGQVRMTPAAEKAFSAAEIRN